MTQKFLQRFIQIGLASSLFVVLFVFKGFLFPFITSKQISFNIIIEILALFWIFLIIKYPKWRPRKNYILLGLVAFFSSITVSSILGVDFNLSFWGDIERMLGVFHLLHFLFFYFMVVTVFRSWDDWRIFFWVSVIISTIVSINGLSGKAYATIGNTAYVSAYIIFNFYFALILAFREKEIYLKFLALFPVIFLLLEFKNADTTGALVGLSFSIFVLELLYLLLHKNKRVKIVFASLILLQVVGLGLIFSNLDSKIVKNNSALRMFRSVNVQKNTFQTRLISWKTAFKDYHNHPYFGTGYGNFSISFDKYFDPTFYNYTRSETYFDRAHNNLVDILSTSGAISLVAYLSLFFAVAFYLIRGYRENKIDIHTFILLSALIIAYFVQNLAVFDSLVTYIGLMMTLGFVYFLYQGGEEDVDSRLV